MTSKKALKSLDYRTQKRTKNNEIVRDKAIIVIEAALKRLEVYENLLTDDFEKADDVDKTLQLNSSVFYWNKVADTQERLMSSVSSDEIKILGSVLNSQINKLKKKLKALEIIKHKQIDVKDIIEVVDDYELYYAYCKGKDYADEYICNSYEFKLLKEVLENGK